MVFYLFHHYPVKGNLLLLVFVVTFCSKSVAQIDSVRQLHNVTIKGTSIVDLQTPTPAQRIDAKDFKNFSAYNVADAIRNFAGVNIKDYGGIGGLKTLSVRSLGAHHTSVIQDGIVISDMQNGQIDLGKISLDNVQSVTLYNGQPSDIALPARSFASASVLAINSAAPQFDSLQPLKIKAGITIGSFGLVHPTFQLQQRLNKKWALRITSNIQKAHGRYQFKVQGDGSDSLVTRSNTEVNSMQNDAAVFWKHNENTHFNFRINYFQSDRGLPGAVVFYNPYSNQHLWNRDWNIQSGFNKKWQRWRLLIHAKYTSNYTRYLDPDYLNQVGELDQRYTQKEYYSSVVLARKLNPFLELSYASDVSLATLKTSNYGFAYPKRLTTYNAISAQFKRGNFELQGTFLHTFIHEEVKLGIASNDKSIGSPSVLATYRPLGSSLIMFRGFYKDIFRAPTFNDLYYVRSGNRSLNPEWTKQYNLGITLQKDYNKRFEYFSFTTDVYYNYVKDKIIAIPNKDLFSWTMLNLGEVDIRGIDVAFKSRAQLFRKFKAVTSLNYTFQEALDITDRKSSVYLNQIPYTPQHSFALNAGLDNNKWSVFVNQTFSSHRYYLSENLPEYYVPGFFITDMSTQYRGRIKGRLITPSFEINNLFNTEYALVRSFPMPGRSYRFSIQINI